MTNEEKLQDRLNKAIEVFRQKEAEIAELKGFIESKDKALKILQDTYNEVFAENTKLKEEIESIKNNNAKLSDELNEAQSDSNHYKLLYNDTNSKLIAYESELKELRSQVNWLDEDNEYLQSRNELLKEKHEDSFKIQTIQNELYELSREKTNIFTPVKGAFTI